MKAAVLSSGAAAARKAMRRRQGNAHLPPTSAANVMALVLFSDSGIRSEGADVSLLWDFCRRPLRTADYPFVLPLCKLLSPQASQCELTKRSVLLLLWKHLHSSEAQTLLHHLVSESGTKGETDHVYLLARCADAFTQGGSKGAEVLGESLARSSEPVPNEVVAFVLSNADPASCAVMLNHVLMNCSLSTPFGDLCLRLLANDHFFRLSSFNSMHAELVRIVQRAGPAAESFGETTLNKCSRVYAKLNRGRQFAEVHQIIVAQAPRLLAKVPLAYMVRLVGSLLDESVDSGDPLCFGAVCSVLRPFLLLRGGDEADRAQTWIIAMKAALTSPPSEQAASRLLDLYVLYSECNAPIEVSKPAFLQVTRLVCERLSVRPTETATLLATYANFLFQSVGVSFHWILDAITAILVALAKRNSAGSKEIAERLVADVVRLLHERKVTGVHLGRIAPLREALVKLGIEEEPLFWWQCGCGVRNPCESTNCSLCVRNSARWQCFECRMPVRSADASGDCPNCGAPNPRLAAATQAHLVTCERCGSVMQEGAQCDCKLSKEGAMRRCSCGAEISSRALYCQNCFTPCAAEGLFLWQCGACFKLNNSSTSRCQSCRVKEGTSRSISSITSAFVPWKCACGTLCHPQSRACATCTANCGVSSYSCPNCREQVTSSSVSCATLLSGKEIVFGTCRGCRTLHPRDSEMIRTSNIPRQCWHCGGERWRNGVCTACSVEADKLPDPRTPFSCEKCGKFQCGFHCSACFTLRNSVSTAFVWRCDRQLSTTDDVCGVWNYSWETSCRKCKQGRIRDHRMNFEVRCRYCPWNCSGCGASHDATTVLLCPSCDEGIQAAPACQLCGLPHLNVECPSTELLEEAASILLAV